ncbi:hypothetical protein LTR28_004469 [Elasticomyces elasticus]|nr:hypothetical protein LTR28_004469 [Elasticomyces elasticus]
MAHHEGYRAAVRHDSTHSLPHDPADLRSAPNAPWPSQRAQTPSTPATATASERLSARSRTSSTSRSEGFCHPQPTGPTHDALNTASDRPDLAGRLDPVLVAQITEQVINSLRASGITAAAAPAQAAQQPLFPSGVAQSAQQPLFPSAAAQSGHEPRSPTSSTTNSIPPRYTPPSPEKADCSSYDGSASPKDLGSPRSSFSRDNRETPRPGRREYVSSPPPVRPQLARVLTAVEETTLEKIWQPLFDPEGRPTPRLGQFLRGLAIHLIEDYEPRYSLVVTPTKMMKFLLEVGVPDEKYPWTSIFGGRMSYASISRLYRDLRCQQHLVQAQTHDVPNIPGLTPAGFECWMTAMILAHPDVEFERMARAVLNMPISNADDPSERFPKQLSRRLFPKQDDLHMQQRLVAAISADPAVQLRNSNPVPPPPPPPPPSTQPPLSALLAERERNPYHGPSFSSAVVDDDDPLPPAIPIERERQPYTAKQGSGKIYSSDAGSSRSYEDTASSRSYNDATTAADLPASFRCTPPAETE